MEFTVTVEMAQPLAEVFDYLTDPRQRPEWQASLRSVKLLDEGEPRLGMHWRETTMIGISPEMEITGWESNKSWSEKGQWAGVTGHLQLIFLATDNGTRVTAKVHIDASGPWTLVAWPAGKLGPTAIRSDLDRASRILTERAASK